MNKNKHSSKLSIVKFLHRMEQKKMTGEELFSYINEMPGVRFNEIARPLKHERAYAMKDAGGNREYKRKQLKENPYFSKGDYNIPDYIRVIFSKRADCELLAVGGNYNDLTIHYKCLRCNEEHLALESNPTAGHNCTSTMSSYEYLVTEFLKERGYHFVSQHKTLRCINPTTNMPLHYDFQLINEKLIIEVQGEQHYKFVEIFHRNEEGFEYQRWKDEYKKNYALNRGFDYLEIRYDEFKNNKYKDIILEKLTS